VNSGNSFSDIGPISAFQLAASPTVTQPVIDYITPDALVNNAPNVITINGSNFSSDAVVKIGTANPIVPTNITDTQLTVTLPAHVASGTVNVIVINQNLTSAFSGRNVASSPTTIYVTDNPNFNRAFDSFTANYGDGSVLQNGPLGPTSSSNGQNPNPWGIAVTPEGVWYTTPGVGFYNGYNSSFSYTIESDFLNEGLTSVQLSGGPAYGDALAVVPDPTSGRNVLLAPSAYSPGSGSYDWQLNVIDVDPYSPTANTILRSIPASLTSTFNSSPAGFAAMPNGNYAYQQVYLGGTGADSLAIYDIGNGTVTTIPSSALGIDVFVQGMQVSPDSQYLAVANELSYNIKIYSLANPTSPTLVATLPLANPNNVTLTDCCNLRFANNELYAFDPGTMLLQAFNFLPATSNFSAAGVLQLPGHLDPTLEGGLAASPGGSYLYVAETDDDAVDVIDTSKIATSDITQALVTRFSSQGTGPVSIAFNPTPTYSNSSDLSVSVSHSPDPVAIGSQITYQITVNNLGPDSSGSVVVTDVLPAGVTYSSADYYCTGTTSVSCSLGTMSPNSSYTVSLIADVSSPTGSTITNTVQVGQTGTVAPDPNLANNTAVDVANLSGPDLVMTASADNLAPQVGGTVNFTLNVSNTGGSPATGVTVTGTLDSGSFSNVGNCTLNSSTSFTCSVGQLAANGSQPLTISATMPGAPGAVNFSTTASMDQTDPTPTNNTATVTIAVGGGADLAVVAAGTPVNVGGVPTYTVVVTNSGPDPAANAVLTDALDRFGFVSATSTVGTCSFNGANVNCALGTLASGASATVNVGVTPPTTGWASNDFHASSSTFDPNPKNNLVSLGPSGGVVGNTGAGSNILVDALDPISGASANFLFAAITKPGLTGVTSTTGTQPPAGYRFGSPALVYDLHTTAAYAGNIRVAVSPGGVAFHHADKIHLFHFENGAWVDRTASVDSTHGTVTGMTSSLSPFIVVEPVDNPPVAKAAAQTVPGSSNGGASVTLDASGSTDTFNTAMTYTWTGPFPEGSGTVTGVNPKVTMPLGASQVTLVVNDGEQNSAPATVNVTVSDFLLAPPTSPITLARGQSTSFNVVLTPKYGAFNEPVTLACGNLPAGVTCSIANDSVTPGAQGASATITLTASGSAAMHHSSEPLFGFWMGGLPVFGVLLTGTMKRKHRRLWLLILTLIAVLLIVGLVACGGGMGGGSNTNSTPTQSATSATVEITATAGGLQHSATAAIAIQ